MPAFVLLQGVGSEIGDLRTTAKSALEVQVLGLCEQHLGPKGFRAVDVDCHTGGRSLVRIFIERGLASGAPDPSRSPSIDDCADASRLIGAALETMDLFEGGYDLEVSSPGLDRRLRLDEDFEAAIGEEVKLKLVENWDGRGINLTGKLERVEDGAVIVSVDKEQRRVPLDKIRRANRVWRPLAG